jgi:hypothetical protein
VRSGASYIDGALFYNNPATVANQERKLLWPDASGQQPDILLSIGTGCPPEDPSPVGSWRRLAGMFQPALNRFDSMLDAQNAWELFYQDVQEGGKTSMANERYIRLNPELKSKIEMDDVRSLKDLRDSVRATLRLPKWIIDCGLVAKRLISSSFYFERDENRLDQETIRGMHLPRDFKCRINRVFRANLLSVPRWIFRASYAWQLLGKAAETFILT